MVVKRRLVSGLYPYVADLAAQFTMRSVEFLDASHPVYALRPQSPLEIVAAASFYSPRDSFVYPGGIEDLGPANEE